MTRDHAARTLRPLPCPPSLPGALRLAGGLIGFREVEVLSRDRPPEVLPVDAALALFAEEAGQIARASAQRPPLAGLDLSRPVVMGIVNVTPDSFSDGGLHGETGAAIAHGLSMADAGAAILDIGGESTRPGARPVPPEEEAARVLPVIEGILAAGCTVPISIDTRNASTARAALDAGARIVNDVSALTWDTGMAAVAATAEAVCLMHAQGDPQTMQVDPRYDDVLLDVAGFLRARVEAATEGGIAPGRLIVDPGIGFGKTAAHNLALIRGLSALHGLGAAVLLGVSRKRFIGTIGGAAVPAARVPGSLAAGLAGLGQGVHILRVHDVPETVQAVRVWTAIHDTAEEPP